MKQFLTKDDLQNIKDIKEPLTKLEILLEILAVIGLLATFIYIALKYSALPARLPMHYGFGGAPDSWGNKTFIWVLPAVGVFLYAILSLAGFSPKHINYPVKITPENVRRQFKVARVFMNMLKVMLIWFFFCLTYAEIQVGSGAAAGLNPIMFVFLILFFVILGLMIYFSFKNK